MARSDTAFIAIDVPEGVLIPPLAQRILNSSPAAGEKVVIAATPEAIDLDPNQGVVPSRPSTTEAYAVPGLRGRPGQSGAPVTSDRGVIGIFTAHAGNEGFVVPISAVRTFAGDVPWMLLDSGDPDPTPVLFCVVHGGRERPAFSLVGVSRIRPGANGCATAAPQRLRLVVDDSVHYQCSPPEFDLRRDQANTPIEVTCDVQIDGAWRSQSFGTLFVTTSGPGQWRIDGLNVGALGSISGDLQGTPRSAGMTGTAFGANVPLLGTWEGRLREATLTLQLPDGTTQTVELSR
jgi:hypothetical protein